MNRIYLVRHGESVVNITKEFSNRHVDKPLTAKGVLQAQQTAEFLVGKQIDAIFCSPLIRARQTAEIIGARLGVPVEVVEHFRELDVGDLELSPPTAEAWALHNDILRSWLTGRPERSFPGGENYPSLVGRMHAGLEYITAGRDGQSLLVVAHGGIVMMSLPQLCPGLELDYLFSHTLHNCSITELDLSGRDGRLECKLVKLAACAHLSGDAADLVAGVPE